MCGRRPRRPRLPGDEFEGQSAFALCAAVQAYLVSRQLYALMTLEGTESSVLGGDLGLGPIACWSPLLTLSLFFQGIVKLEHPRIHVDFPVIICEV